MTTPVYSSLTAFLAHYHALRALHQRSPEQDALLDRMKALIEELGPREGQALASGAGPDHARHRERAQRHLMQLLRQRGVLSG